MKSLWILAGEASGDLYGAMLAKELRQIAAERGEKLTLSGMGGPRMIAEKIDLKVDSTELGVMGIVEVLKLLFTFVKIFFSLIRDARKERPDAVVLIDYPGFNLLFALAMYWSRIKVIWYVSPQLWVWGKWRLPVLSRICTKMLVIFPFEVDVYRPTRLAAEFTGHPLIDIVDGRRDPAIVRDPDSVLLLPGSRMMEISRLLLPMLDTVSTLKKRHPQLTFHLAAPREKVADTCRQMMQEYRKKFPGLPEISISVGDTGSWLQRAGTALAASGTVTVECAIAGLPAVVGYKLNWITLLIAAILVKLYRGFFCMVNIIAGKSVFREFLQYHFSEKELLPALEEILPEGSRRKEVEAGMQEVRDLLSSHSSSAARQAAEACSRTIGLLN